jgi:serine/threonine protein kinase
MRRLHHPNIIEFVDVYERRDETLLVMEYVPGKDLFDVSDQSNPNPILCIPRSRQLCYGTERGRTSESKSNTIMFMFQM